MDKETFTKQLKERLEEITECKVYTETNTKNNGVELESLTIIREGRNAYPTIYVDIWWDIYKAGESFDDIVAKVLEWEKKSALSRKMDLDFFLDFDRVKENLRYKIINTEKNVDLLNSIPHKDFLDLSKVYMVEVNTPEIGRGTVLVSNVHMELWKTTWEELDRYATEQTEKQNPSYIFDMVDMATEMLEKAVDVELPDFEIPHGQMYVITNQERYFGAAVLLYKDVFKNFATEKEEDLYILPSSTHEVIVIPASLAQYQGIKGLKEMVKEVNSTHVEPEEFLSDNIYFYDRQTDSIKIV